MPKITPRAYVLCTTPGCPCITEWAGECEPAASVSDVEHKCIGPITAGDPNDPSFIGFINHNTCTCPAMNGDVVCWGCYLDSK